MRVLKKGGGILLFGVTYFRKPTFLVFYLIVFRSPMVAI